MAIILEFFPFPMLYFNMIRDVSLHGRIGHVEFSSLVWGEDTKNMHFYDETPTNIRFFSRGNEFSITPEGARYRGAGGSFCEYMFGVEKPLEDFANKEILNRLIMFGAFTDKGGKLLFTNNTDGEETFDRLFLQGHAVKNYYFFVAGSHIEDIKKKQRHILSRVGKMLKRTDLIGADRDIELLNAFCRKLAEQDSTVFIFKLTHKGNEEFYRKFNELYFKDRTLSNEDEQNLADIAVRNNIDYYQQERMKIDIMYRHPENKFIVDEYRDILLSSIHKDTIQYSELARLRRLKTLRIRNNIPSVLFEALDEVLLKGKKLQDIEEPEYLKEARSILENLFFSDPSLKRHIIKEDITRLIKSKHNAYSNGNMGFEKILLDVGRTCDETAKESNDYSLFEEFSAIVTYFDRYDHVQASMSQAAFTENIEFTEDFLRSLLGNKKEFDSLGKGLFDELFVKSLLNNKYITKYGKKKIKTIYEGIKRISVGDASLRDVASELKKIVIEERLYRHVHTALKEKLRSFYPRFDLKEGKEELRADIENELKAKGITWKVTEAILDRVFLDLKKESFYLNHLLPIIIKNVDTELREDFFKNSGLDRFYIESIEKDYFEENGLDMFLLNLIREDKARYDEHLKQGSYVKTLAKS
ncbi:MAG: TIGR04442 family protein [Nitrospirae bacterium]|nr:TIGR04442 family protein [Nitrospirota bacterium]